MTRKRKKKPLPPRRKRMKRAARLQAAPAWLARYSGKNVVRSYARWFGVDLGCALVELQLLGVDLDPGYVTALRRTLEERGRSRRADPEEEEGVLGESDEWFAYIAGYTPGGLPFGISWEEWEILEKEDADTGDP